jgi:tetratricopeptide (TPR) repeat protein
MKYLLFLSAFFVIHAKAQNNLVFEHRYAECEDRWVAFEQGKDTSYMYGFIYMDEQAGLTFNYEGKFKIGDKGEFAPSKIEGGNMKVRLKPNKNLVAFIPENKFSELKISKTPDWLKHYKNDTTSIEHLYRWGFIYNGLEECAKGLTYLEKAQKINPKFKGLAVELAFSYNCLKQHEKAISVLSSALEADPKDAYTNKELVYAQVELGELDKAAEQCKKAIRVCTEKTYNGEMCYNVLQAFYIKKDKKNFKKWQKETQKWTADNAQITASIKAMEERLNK